MTAEVQAFIEAEKEADRNVLKACELLVVSRSASMTAWIRPLRPGSAPTPS
jgi:hypothetical protein